MRSWPAERWGQIALVVGCLAIAIAAGLYYRSTKQFTPQEVTEAIQKSRIVLSGQACHQRNKELKSQRHDKQRDLANLAQIPDAALQQLGFTRAEALAQIRGDLRRLAPIDCKAYSRQVLNLPKVSSGGGPGVSKTPRPQASTGRDERGATEGGSSPPGSGSPPQGEPSPDNGKPPSGGSPTPGQPTEPVKPPVTTPSEPTPSEPSPEDQGLVSTVVDTVGQVLQKVPQLLQVPQLP